MNLKKLDSPQNTLWLIFYEFPSNNNSYDTRIVPRYSLDIRKMCQRVSWKATKMHVPKKLESYQNIIPTGHSNLIIAIYPNHQYNYYRENKQPKIANQVSQAIYHIQLALRIGNTTFQSTEPHIWIFE
jgi:hypothetical protein